MSISDWGLLIKYIIEGIKKLYLFYKDEKVRGAFNELHKASTSNEKQDAAQRLAKLIYGG